jgi:hypothetical protein
MFPQIRTRVIIHETTSILPCRGGGGGLLHSLSPRDIAFSKGLNVDGRSKAPLPGHLLARERR